MAKTTKGTITTKAVTATAKAKTEELGLNPVKPPPTVPPKKK